jgi:two-component system cell cycle response regulator
MIAVVAHHSQPIRRQAAETLREAACTVHEAHSADEAIAVAREVKPDVLLAAHDLDEGALNLIERLKRDLELFRIAVVILGGDDLGVQAVLEALDHGADDVLRTPLHPGDVVGRAFAAARTKALVEELTLQNDRLEELVFFDELTGVRNRRAILHELEMLQAGASRHGHHLSVLMLDIDRFKPINDRHGHRAGDFVLREVAQRMLGRLRRGDFAGRLGGDEFLVVLPDTDGPGAAIVADSIREAVSARPIDTACGPIEATISIGSAEWDAEDLPRLLEKADRALYQAKDAGRDRSVLAA